MNNKLHVEVAWDQEQLEECADDAGCVSVSEYVRHAIRVERDARAGDLPDDPDGGA